MHPEMALILLFTAATAVAIGARHLKIPYTVALVLAGLGLGATHLVHDVHLTKDLLFSIFLPGLIFEAAYHLKITDFRENARAIIALAVPGVVVAIGATAALLVTSSSIAGSEKASFDWTHSLVFASLIAATDPIAVVALFKTLGAPKRLGVLIEGESLVNDGTAIVLFTIVYGAVTTTGGVSIASGVFDFARIVGTGFVVGAVIGFAASRVIRRVDDPMIEITVTMITAYGSFALAEELGASGVIATVTAGMIAGSFAARVLTKAGKIAVESFWEYLAFALNSIVFLLIGTAVSITRLVHAWLPILLAFIAVTVGRAIVVFAASIILRPTSEKIPWQWSVMLTWGGLRGALSMVLALTLPSEFPNRDLIVTMTFGVVLLSIVVQGISAGPLLRALGLASSHPESS